MTWLRARLWRLRIFLGIDTEADRRARHVDMLKRVQDAANEYDRRDMVDERTPVERRRPKR